MPPSLVRGVFDDSFRSHHKELLKTIQQTLRRDQLTVKGVFSERTGWIDLGKGEATPVNTRCSASKTTNYFPVRDGGAARRIFFTTIFLLYDRATDD